MPSFSYPCLLLPALCIRCESKITLHPLMSTLRAGSRWIANFFLHHALLLLSVLGIEDFIPLFMVAMNHAAKSSKRYITNLMRQGKVLPSAGVTIRTSAAPFLASFPWIHPWTPPTGYLTYLTLLCFLPRAALAAKGGHSAYQCRKLRSYTR